MTRVARSFVVAAFLLIAPSALHAQCDHFRRGDTNADGQVDLSDAVATLLFLFVSGPAPSCMDAADADDSGELLITDAVYTLGFLFLGSPPPPPPGPFECGRDATFDSLDCQSHDVCDPVPSSRDFSGFTRFEYHEDPALGFCPEPGKVFTAAIEKLPTGSYHLDMTVLRIGTEGVDNCLPHIRGTPCLVEEPVPSHDLTGDETKKVLGIFQSVLVHDAQDLICECIAIDPCRIAQFAWDATTASDFLCSPPYLDGAQSGPVLELLEGLRAGG